MDVFNLKSFVMFFSIFGCCAGQELLPVLEALSGTTLKGPTVTLLAGNQTADLRCQASAGKATTQAWFKDGKPLSPSGRVSVSADKSMVTIKPVQKEDNGEYRCELTNAVSNDSATYKMVVNYGPEGIQLTINELNVKLTCSAISMPPATYTWKFNGRKTAITTAEYPIGTATNTGLYNYTCEAHNAITGLSVTAMHTLSEEEDGLTVGGIVGITIAVLLLVACGFLFLYCKICKK